MNDRSGEAGRRIQGTGEGRSVSEIDAELRFHLEVRAAELVQQGMQPAEALAEARRRFGDLERIREECTVIRRTAHRRRHRAEVLLGLWSDARYALRSLLRNPSFTAVAVLTLALGIGANTAVFSVVDAVLLRPLPFPEPERLVSPGHLMAGEFLVVKERSGTIESLGLFQAPVGLNLTTDAEPERIVGAEASAGLFPTLGVQPVLGRGFLEADERPGAEPVALLSHSTWRQRFGSDPGVLGRSVSIDSEPRTIVGVLPPDFRFPASNVAAWIPMTIDPGDPVALWGGAGGQAIARLRPGADITRAQADLRALAPLLREANTLWTPAPDFGTSRTVVGLHDQIVGDVRVRMWIALGAVALVLLIACVNVANLLLTREAGRSREFAIRRGLGAGRGRLVRQLLTENLILATVGGTAGIGLGYLGVRLLTAGLPADTPRLAEIGMDGGVLGFAAAATLLSGLLFGLLPALRASRPDLHGATREGGGGAGTSRGHRRLSGTLVAAEIALAVVLVTGAGLLLRSFRSLTIVDPGFRTEALLSARVTPPDTRYTTPDRQRAFYTELIEQIGTIPGVQGVAMTDRVPLSDWAGGVAFETEDEPYVPGTAAPMALSRRITPEYPELMGIRLLGGRPLIEADGADAPDVALVNETMARRHWPGEDPIGKRFRPVWWQDRWITVVGVLADVRQHGLAAEIEPEMYRPFRQDPGAEMSVVVSTPLAPGLLSAPLREAVSGLDPEVPISELRSLREAVSLSVATPRFTTILLALFAGVALLLGAVGIYGVVAYDVGRRRQELGIRTALGARPGDLVGLVTGHVAMLAGAGIGLGLLGALLAAGLLRGVLHGVEPLDPITFAAVPLILGLVALTAGYIPARRATKLDPITSLRQE